MGRNGKVYTLEVFPTQHRGTGNGLASTANRVGGIVAPVIAICVGLGTPVPVFIAGSLFFVSAALMVPLLPFESRGRSCLQWFCHCSGLRKPQSAWSRGPPGHCARCQLQILKMRKTHTRTHQEDLYRPSVTTPYSRLDRRKRTTAQL